jgi:hypothetical protein
MWMSGAGASGAVGVALVLGPRLVQPAVGRLPEFIAHDAELWPRNLNPVAGRSCRLLLLSPVVALAGLVPCDHAAVRVPEQHLVNGRWCPRPRPVALRLWRDRALGVQLLRDAGLPYATST